MEAVILGVVQGATEFLLISSSAHLLLVPDILDIPAPGLTMVGVVHGGTAVERFFSRTLPELDCGSPPFI